MGIEAMLLAAAGGALIGLLLTLFGGGGSVLATPWLIYVVGLADTHAAIGTSAAAVAVNAATGLAGQARAGRVKWPCATVCFPASPVPWPGRNWRRWWMARRCSPGSHSP